MPRSMARAWLLNRAHATWTTGHGSILCLNGSWEETSWPVSQSVSTYRRISTPCHWFVGWNSSMACKKQCARYCKTCLYLGGGHFDYITRTMLIFYLSFSYVHHIHTFSVQHSPQPCASWWAGATQRCSARIPATLTKFEVVSVY